LESDRGPEEALLTIDSAVSLANKSGAKFCLAELLHIKARILASMFQPSSAEAMGCLAGALTIAREQGALALSCALHAPQPAGFVIAVSGRTRAVLRHRFTIASQMDSISRTLRLRVNSLRNRPSTYPSAAAKYQLARAGDHSKGE
jgi:hypothetical protein